MPDEKEDESIGVEQLPQTELESTPDQDYEPRSDDAEKRSNESVDPKELPPFLQN